MVVKVSPVTNVSAGVLQGLKAVTVHVLLLQNADYSVHHPILFRRLRRDEFLLQPIAFDQCHIAAAGEYQAVVRAKQEGRLHPCPDPAQISRQAFIGRFGHRRQPLDTRREAHRTLAYLPALTLEHILHRVLVRASFPVFDAQQGVEFFSGTQLQHGIATCLLQDFDLALVMLFDFQWLGAQSVLHAPLGFVYPLFDLRGRNVKGPTCLSNRGLALNDFHDQCRFALGRPAFDVFFHLHAHLCFLQR